MANIRLLQAQLKALCQEQQIGGTILLAPEGINSTIAGTKKGIANCIEFLKKQPELHDLECKYSISQSKPFNKMKVLLKKEIVTLKVPTVDPTKHSGIYVTPEDWNDLITKEDVLLLDTRNAYETEMGTFQGAHDPKTRHFSDFPEFVKTQLNPSKHKKIAMFCTGGIRCEKASSYLLQEGFETVYQLQGGILKYLEKIPAEKSLWQGKCFIFDNRVILEKENIINDQP